MQNRMDRIRQYLKEKTRVLISNGRIDREGVDALNCALDLNLDRANVSKDLNKLWKDGKVIKIQGKPVYYLDYDVLLTAYPNHFFPSVIPKSEKFANYINHTENNAANSAKEREQKDPLDSLIGLHGSMSDVILNAKSAIAYPPYGINTLIIGNPGVGKTHLANQMVKYAHKIRNNSRLPFITIHCQNYQENAGLFTLDLLGCEKKSGKQKQSLFEQYAGGILLFEQIELLPYSCQNLLATILNQKKYTPAYGKEEFPLQVMVIATSEKAVNDPAIRILSQVIPIQLFLQDIDKRGLYEKMELIMDLFSQEAIHTQSAIRVHKDIIACFASKKFDNNIVQMRNEIQIACGKAYLETVGADFKSVYVTYQNLSLNMLSQSEEIQQMNANIMILLSCIPTDFLQFSPDGSSKAAAIFHNAPSVFNEHRLRQFVDEFNINVSDLDNIDDYVLENISVLKDCPDPQLEAIKRNINPYVYQITLQKISKYPQLSALKNNSKLLYGILLHITNYLKRVEQNKEEPLKQSVTCQIYHEEYLCAKEIYQTFGNIYNFAPSEREIDFLTSYLAIARQWVAKVNVAILVICHGESIASQMVEYVKQSVEGEYSIDCINFTSSIQLNDLLELACLKTLELNKGAGVLIACDMEPLTSIGEYVRRQTRIPTRTMSGISLASLIRLVEQSKSTLNDIDSIRLDYMPKEEAEPKVKQTTSSFIDQIRDKIIAKTVEFIDTEKAVSILNICLKNTLKELDQPYSDVIAVKYLCHCTNMLERVITKETWDFNKLNVFMQKNYYVMHAVEHGLEIAADSFGIKIPSSELAYVTQIFLP